MKKRRWVIKAGSQMVCQGGTLLARSWMEQVHKLKKQFGVEVIWVTSGAIALAVDRTDFAKRRRTLPEKQALSAIGQPLVMNLYNVALGATGQLGSQVLLTAGDMRDPVRRRNLQNVLNQLLSWKVLPILNENDAVATDEIKFGDNDSLAAKVAVMMNAERLILLTDVEGLYDADPKTHKTAQAISFLPRVTPKHLKMASKGKSRLGTGGMYSKLLAAKKLASKGLVTHLVRGDLPGNLLAIAQGTGVSPGTQIGGKKFHGK